MTPEQFKEARRKLGLTQAQLGTILDTSPTTIRKWEMSEDKSTARGPNPVACQAMRWMLGGYRPPEWPA
ncbi:MAG: helix-turn-helix transcriptional regulator [Pseudomonadota bacterium]